MFALHSFLRLLEGTGPTAFDMHTNHLDGTRAGNTTWQPKGILFGASIARIITPAALTFPAASGSIEMLVKPYWNNADGLNHFLWDTYGGNNQRFCLYKSGANTTVLLTNTIDRGNFVFSWVASTIYHIVLNWGLNTLYIDKILVKDYNDGGLGTGASTLYIADKYTGGACAFYGIVYYCITRTAPLTEAQIATQYSLMKKFYP